MFFTIETNDGRVYRTNAISPSYRESDHAQLLVFAQKDQLVTLTSDMIAKLELNSVPFPEQKCRCH